ncbi:MAG: hypothetical protein AAF390_09875 [Pseudomonadota bacterium]
MIRVVLIASLLVSGCARLPFFGDRGIPDSGAPAPAEVVAPVPRPGTVVSPLAASGASATALDTVSEAEKAAARDVAAAAPGGDLGEITVSLGDPAETGLWVKTSLVAAEAQGTVRRAGGEPIAVTLRPLAGSGGAQISLSALQALGLPLAGLSPVIVAQAG